MSVPDAKPAVTETEIGGTVYIVELDTEILRELVEKIVVQQSAKVDGHRVQRITIHYNGIGPVALPDADKA